MDEHLRGLERRQDLDALERLEEKGVSSYFLDQVRARARQDLLSTLRERVLLTTRLLISGTVLRVLYGGREYTGWVIGFDDYLYLPGIAPGLAGSLRVIYEHDGVRYWNQYWWGGHARWIKFDPE